jgi:multidrug efflux pump subunit AcrB
VRRAIAWFAENHVAANLLMVLMVVGGLVTLPFIPLEVFPEIETDLVTTTVEYRGAAPEEVEEGICIRIEEELEGIDGIKRIRSTAVEGVGVVTAEIVADADLTRVLDDIKSRVDAITTFPDESEKPIVSQIRVRSDVLNVAVSGEADERTLKSLGERVREDIADLPGVTHVELANARSYEISIEVSEAALRRHGLTFDQVAGAVRRSSLDIPGGSVKTAGGEILLRSKGQAYRGPEFEQIVLLTRADGTRVTLGQVADVVDGFEDTDQSARFDGVATVLVKVYRVGEQNALDIAREVKQYVETAQAEMPQGITLTVWQDESEILQSRLNTLLRNARTGFALVLLVLALFLRPRLAFWVSIGIPISFLGALWLLPSLDVTINVISLFAFILVLGILVDDAIVVGENVHTHRGRTKDRLTASVEGTQEVAIPVIFGVLTTIAAFTPMLLVPGAMGQVIGVIGIVVIACLVFSILESQLVLPAHLAHSREEPAAAASRGLLRVWRRFQERFSAGFERFVHEGYRAALERTLAWRYAAVSAGFALLIVTVSYVGSGWIRFSFFPAVEADNVVAFLTMPEGTPVEETAAAVRRLEATAGELKAQLDTERGPNEPAVVQHLLASVGQQPYRLRQSHSPTGGSGGAVGSHLGEVNVALISYEASPRLSAAEFANRWRELTGPIPGAVELAFTSSLFSAGEAIHVQLRGESVEELRSAADRLKGRLAEYPGVIDISDTFRSGQHEVRLSIRPTAEMLGLTLADLGRQVRQAFYGEEAQRIQRGRDELRVMVRYPAEERRSLGDLENMRIRTFDGAEVPFWTVAQADFGRGYSTIRRMDRQRIVSVTADVDIARANANEVLADVRRTVLPGILSDHPGVGYSLEGEQREQRETLGSLGRLYLIALFTIYTLLAIPLRSYTQPLIIMGVIPFGMIGAIAGHVLMGYQLSMMSVIGVIALSGVVVNSSLVLIDYVNRRRAAGMHLVEAVRTASVARFRPIVLTALTTFAGLTPLMLERSLQARVLIPMALSLAFGVIFAAAISLLLLPCAYLILDDLQRLRGRPEPSRAPVISHPTAEPPRPRRRPAAAAGS